MRSLEVKPGVVWDCLATVLHADNGSTTLLSVRSARKLPGQCGHPVDANGIPRTDPRCWAAFAMTAFENKAYESSNSITGPSAAVRSSVLFPSSWLPRSNAAFRKKRRRLITRGRGEFPSCDCLGKLGDKSRLNLAGSIENCCRSTPLVFWAGVTE